MPRIYFRDGLSIHAQLSSVELIYDNGDSLYVEYQNIEGNPKAGQVVIDCDRPIENPQQIHHANEHYPIKPITVPNIVERIL